MLKKAVPLEAYSKGQSVSVKRCNYYGCTAFAVFTHFSAVLI